MLYGWIPSMYRAALPDYKRKIRNQKLKLVWSEVREGLENGCWKETFGDVSFSSPGSDQRCSGPDDHGNEKQIRALTLLLYIRVENDKKQLVSGIHSIQHHATRT